MVKYLKDFSLHLSDGDINTDEFLVEGMTFQECIELMDHIATAIERYVITHSR